MYNYFPITFRPPPNDPYGITAQDLKGRLQDCISSTSRFAPHAFPALLDKLDSTSPTVKRDALNALIACIRSYDPDTVSRFSITVWDVLRLEILHVQEEFLEDLSLEALRAVAQRLSEGVVGPVNHDIPLAHFLAPITKECNEQLREPQQKQAKPAQRILGALSSASAAAFTLVVQDVVPPLFTVYQDADGITKQRALLDTFVILFESALTVFGQWVDRTALAADAAVPQNPLDEFRDQFSEVFGQALMGTSKEEASFRVTALKGLLALSRLRHFFQDNEIGLFVQYLDEILLNEESSSVGGSTRALDLKNEAIAALVEISRHKPRLIMDITFPTFVATLPDYAADESAEYMATLETLARISVERETFDVLVRRLLSKMDLLLQKEHPGSAAYPRAILLTILYVMSRRSMDQDPNLGSYYDRIIVRFCQAVADSASGRGVNRILNDPSVLDTLGRLSNLIVRSLPRSWQDQVAENVYTLFTEGKSFIPIPFSAEDESEDRQRTIIISTYLLAGLPKDSATIPYTSPDMTHLLSDLVGRSVARHEPSTHIAFLRHVALLVNKFLPTSQLAQAYGLLVSLEDGKTNLLPETIHAIFWLSKALVLRLAPSTTQVLTSLLSLLSSSDPLVSTTAAHGFSVLLGDDDVLSPANGANIRLLAKQRVFTTLVPLIATMIRDLNLSSSSSNNNRASVAQTKPACLTALSGILSTIPPSLVMLELPTLLPLLLQSLDLQSRSSVSVRAATLETLAVIIRESGVHVIDECGHVQSLVTRLLRTAEYIPPSPVSSPSSTSPYNSPRLRADAIKCLFLLAKRPDAAVDAPPVATAGKLSPLLPVKSQVLRELKLALDDPRRDVRKAAVDASGAWLRGVEDVPEEDD